MLGELPSSLLINGREVQINTDFRYALIVMQAFNDPELNIGEKIYVTIDTLIGMENIKPSELEEAYKQCSWFLDGGRDFDEDKPNSPKLMDWEQDEQMIFSAVNDVARFETRAQEYIHWWTFLGYFNEIREGLFSTVLMIRQKKKKGKKLEKYEQDFYFRNKEIVDLKTKYTKEEQEYIDRMNELLG